MDLRVHKTLATVRRDGSPRISGIEARFIEGDLWLGSMLDSPKSRDLAADPRFALHSGSTEPDVWGGDAKVAGTLSEVLDRDEKTVYVEAAGTAPPGGFHLYRADITEVVLIRLGDPPDHLHAQRWTPQTGVRTRDLR
jgi:hypothetical protein